MLHVHIFQFLKLILFLKMRYTYFYLISTPKIENTKIAPNNFQFYDFLIETFSALNILYNLLKMTEKQICKFPGYFYIHEQI